MSKRNRHRPYAATAEQPPVQNAQPQTEPVQNGLGEAIGFGGGFPGNQGSPWTEQISNTTTIFKNLRWYLISNFRQVLSEAYVELGLIQVICDVPVDDALRGGIEVKSKQLDPDQVEELLVSLDRDNDINTAGQAAKWNRLFGGAGLMVLTDQDPEEPFDLEAIGPDTPLEFRAVDMWELFWDKQNSEGYDPEVQSEDFDYYNYYGRQVHKSRVMRLKGLTAPSFIRPRLRGWGFSVVEILVRSINQYLKATDLAFEVLDEFKLDVYKIKNLVNTLMSPLGQQQIQKRVQMANWQKNYQNALVMDSEDDYDHKQLSFAGLGDAMQQIRMQVASDMRMPLSKLFGISASGFNSGEDDLEVYNSMVESQVRNKLKYDLLRICEIKCQKLFGFVPDDMSVGFKPLRILSSEQEENVKTQKFTRLFQAKQAGEITTEEFRDACNRDELLGIQLDTTVDLLPDPADAADEGAQDPDKPKKGDDDPGANREDTQKSKAGEKGGIGKEPPSSKDAPSVKVAPDAPNAKVAKNSFDESKHPRADDGKFGEGGATASKMSAVKKKHPSLSGDTYHSEGSKDEAAATAKALRKDGVHATIIHMDGPRSGAKSKFYVMVPESKQNARHDSYIRDALDRTHRLLATDTIERYSTIERIERVVVNSATFDRASYEADGGDSWIDSRRKELFDKSKAADKGLWQKAVDASKAALGSERWQFVVWLYEKFGGQWV